MEYPHSERCQSSSSQHYVDHQVEISHGSASSKPSIFHSEASRCQPCCCVELVLGIFALMAVLAVVLLWLDTFPSATQFFSHHKSVELVTFAALLAIASVSLMVVIGRGVWRLRRYVCHGRVHVAFSAPHSTESIRPILRGDYWYDNIPRSARSTQGQGLPNKLSDLHTEDLRNLKRILDIFISSPTEDKWLFTTSTSTLSRVSMISNQDSDMTDSKIIVLVKMVLTGEPNVGKTSIFHRILYNRFSEYYMATLGAELGHTVLHIFPKVPENHVEIRLQLWDIAGSERLQDLTNVVYKDSYTFLVVADANCLGIDNVIKPWVDGINQCVSFPYVGLLANKIDLAYGSSMQRGHYHFSGVSYDVHFVSAKTGCNLLASIVHVIAKSLLHQIDMCM